MNQCSANGVALPHALSPYALHEYYHRYTVAMYSLLNDKLTSPAYSNYHAMHNMIKSDKTIMLFYS